jgi:ABC-2 type transport system ATP-binding protein
LSSIVSIGVVYGPGRVWMAVLAFDGVTKVFRSSIRGRHLYTLGPVDLSIEQGEVFGYLGPNAAGKTTTIKLAMGLIKPTSGKIEIFGASASSTGARKRVGFLPEQPYFYQHLTARELLEFYGGLFGVPWQASRRRADELLDLVGLRAARDMAVSKFSRGMLQRIGLAQAIVNDPDLVILDEPLTGLDPVGRRDIRDLILGLKARGKTVFFSSHILQDVEMICDRVGILVEGKVLRVASVAEVLAKSVRWVEVEVSGLSKEAAQRLGLEDVQAAGEKAVVKVAEGTDLNAVIGRLIAAGATIASVMPMRLTLEDYFLSEIEGRPAPDRSRKPGSPVGNSESNSGGSGNGFNGSEGNSVLLSPGRGGSGS